MRNHSSRLLVRAVAAIAVMAVGGGCAELRNGQLSGTNGADAGPTDAEADTALPSLPLAAISGGPCASGAVGSTAFRVTWTDHRGTAASTVDKQGLPDPANFKIAAATKDDNPAEFGDPNFDSGGADLQSGSVMTITLSTRGVPRIKTATLAVRGRSYDTSTSGSFSWQTDAAKGTTPANGISVGVPYEWTQTDITKGLPLDTAEITLTIRPGPASMALVVHRVELCLDTVDP